MPVPAEFLAITQLVHSTTPRLSAFRKSMLASGALTLFYSTCQ